MINPSKITEGGVVYTLGDFDGKWITYDFKKILTYLEIKGKLLFGKHFKISKIDHQLLRKLCFYIVRDRVACEKFGIDLDKGLLVIGPVGCGKTSILKLLNYIVPQYRPYTVVPSRNIVFSFNHLGYKTIEDYGNSKFFCFDDLGAEPPGRFYGKDCNVIGEVLLSRYDLYLNSNKKIKTHATTNLNAEELEARYGNRVRSRMRELFNLISFAKNSPDKRK